MDEPGGSIRAFIVIWNRIWRTFWNV